MFLALAIFIFAAAPARADLEICNRTSFVLEAAIGIESKGAAATRGWFRVDPGACRAVLRGELIADHLYIHARALPLYGTLQPLSTAHINLCAGNRDFLLADAKKCAKPQERLLPFAEVSPRKAGKDSSVFIAETAGYDAEHARFAAVQRLLTLAGYDAEPIDGTPDAKSDAALAAFLKSRNFTPDAALRPDFFDVLIAAAQDGQAPGLLWCNDTKHTVMAALAIEENNTITSRGWWKLDPGACVRPEMPRRLSGRVFSFAEAVDVSGAVVERKGRPLLWGGDEKFCVKNIRFEIREHANCGALGLDLKGFQPLQFSGSEGTTLRFREP